MASPAVDNPAQPSPSRCKGFYRRGLQAAAGLLALGLSGCQSMMVNAGNVAMLRVVDVSPDAPGLDFYENGSAIAYNIGYGTVSSYIAFAPGSYTLSTDQANTRTQLTTASGTLANTRQYTLLISNVNSSLQETLLQDQNTPAPAGQIAVRILDEATKVSGAVDVYFVPSSGKLSMSAPLATNLAFGSNSGYLSVPAGTYALAVVPAGTVPSSSTGTLYTGSQVNYTQGAARTVVLMDQQIITSPGVQALVASDFDVSANSPQ